MPNKSISSPQAVCLNRASIKGHQIATGGINLKGTFDWELQKLLLENYIIILIPNSSQFINYHDINCML